MSGVAEYHLCSILYIGGSMLINVVKNIIISLSNVMIINKGLLMLADYLAIVTGLWAAYHLRINFYWISLDKSFRLQPFYILGVIPLLFIFVFLLNDTYEIEAPYWDKIKKLFRSVTIGVIVAIVLMYSGHVTNNVSRLFVAFSYGVITINVIVFRYIVERILLYLHLFGVPVLLIGAGKTAELVNHAFNHMPIMCYKIIGYIDDHPKSEAIASQYPCLGSFNDIEQVIKRTGVRNVLVCAPGLEAKELVALINKLQLLVQCVSFVPELFGVPAGNVSVQGMMEEQALIIRVQNNLAKKVNRIIKRVFDIVVTVCGGILILPFVAVIALLIRLDSPGPVVFAHRRIGQGGKEFSCYKFRSMMFDAEGALKKYLAIHPEAQEEWGRNFKLKDDPRITKIGRFLRKTSLDELPQLWNVLVGDMSLVGPRPIVKDEIVKYGTYINDFYLVPPGITGVWQVSGRSDTTYDERVQMDSWYVHNWSVWIDIVYLVKTVLAVVKGKGAY